MGVIAKNPEATLLFMDFNMAFVYIHRGKMEQRQQAYGQSKNVSTLKMLYKNTKEIVYTRDGDTNFFEIVFVV